MTKLKIIYDKKGCIGAGECEVLSPRFWKVNNRGQADLAGSVLNEKTGNHELVIDEKDLDEQEMVVGSCPVNCIRIERSS